MRRFIIFFCVVVSTLFNMHAQAQGFGLLEEEKGMVLQRIQCSMERYSPPEYGLGGLWGCLATLENPKLFMNCDSSSTPRVVNVKLMFIQYHGKGIDFTAKFWAEVLAEQYLPSIASQVVESFCRTAPYEVLLVGENGFQATITANVGPSADEHIILIEETQ